MHHRNTFRFVGAMRIAKFLHVTPQRVEAIQDRLQVDCYGVDGLQPSSAGACGAFAPHNRRTGSRSPRHQRERQQGARYGANGNQHSGVDRHVVNPTV